MSSNQVLKLFIISVINRFILANTYIVLLLLVVVFYGKIVFIGTPSS